jgi:hypothetical protein
MIPKSKGLPVADTSHMKE